jgi:carbonic anhydrase
VENFSWSQLNTNGTERPKAMDALKFLFANNKAWAAEKNTNSPGFFANLSKLQAPDYLWIGCSDSRVPANEIVGLQPGELFVHRNVANVVTHADLNCLSVLQYAVEALKVRYVIVCGHYGCGGVLAAQKNLRLGLIDNWLRHIQDVQEKYRGLLDLVPEGPERDDRLCELNVIEQAVNVCQTTVVQEAWDRGQELTVYGWIYRLNDGLLRDLGLCVSSNDGLHDYYRVSYSINEWPVPRDLGKDLA